ncbi:DUF2255 family protein [Burkholderia ambifaria]|uniref:DUF2255 family protein n=1 Tax=Burkholderia ambifaria TaxID=152480 RepID=UPI001FC84322|nr:DUF2255 family protein [Burkholderia ambifaria]
MLNADDLNIAPFRDDGKTPGTPTWIWCVAVDGELYVRAYNGRQSRWYQAAIRQRAGQIIAAGMIKHVTFEPVAGELNASIDDASWRRPGSSGLPRDKARAAGTDQERGS